SGMVESRIRHLISKLENVENLSLAHPFVKGFDKVYNSAPEQEANDISHGIFDSKSSSDKSSSSESSQNGTEKNIGQTLYTTTFYVGLLINPREAGSTSPRQLNISWPTQEFMKLVRSWDKFDEKTMDITIKYVKSADLPPEVFEEGEPRPTKLKRSKPSSKTEQHTTTSEQPSKKHRTFGDTLMHETAANTTSEQPSEKRTFDDNMMHETGAINTAFGGQLRRHVEFDDKMVREKTDKITSISESNRNIKPTTRTSTSCDIPSSSLNARDTRISQSMESAPLG
ncbi:5506_t:CDS:2, partial [Acaulospora morrowiae]